MNKLIKITRLKTLLRTSFFAMMLALASGQMYGQSVPDLDSAAGEVSVQYLGTENDMMLIGVKYINETGNRFNLSICNTDGEVLFRNIYSDKNFNQKFKIPSSQVKLNFEIGGKKSYKSFEVYNGAATVKDVVVQKLH
jgi:hypothetical protein